MPAETVPLISLLEPIAGAGLAVSLAYLALERFRYRSAIEKIARPMLAKYEAEDWQGGDFERLKDLKWLCRSDCGNHTPRGFGSNFYRFVFRRQFDEWLVAFLGTVAGYTLLSGVAFQIDRWQFLNWTNLPPVVGIFFYVCGMAIFAPAVLVLCGRRSVKWGNDFASSCELEVLNILKQSARNAAAPIDVAYPASGTPPPTPGNDESDLARRRAATLGYRPPLRR